MKLSIGYKMDAGPREGRNQDALLAVHPGSDQTRAVLIVSDGMGGANAGDMASREALRVLKRHLVTKFPPTDEIPDRLRKALYAANRAIYEKASNSPALDGMGCTAVIAVVDGDSFWIANVGDSRAYLLRSGTLHQITDDHTWLNARVREGLLTAEQAAGEFRYLNHVLDRALGTAPGIEVDVWPASALQPGDVLILCTDGLYGVLSPRHLMELAAIRPAQRAAEALITAGLAAPAHDNLSVVILQVE